VLAFTVMVDDAYRRGFQRHYSTFTYLNDYIVGRNDYLALYDQFVALFPCIHSVFALTVSSSRARGERVALSASFDGFVSSNFGVEDEVFDDSDSGGDSDFDKGDDGDSGDLSAGCGETEEQYLLSKKERAIMEFFFANAFSGIFYYKNNILIFGRKNF
jgi:hypothetical protein